MTRPGVPPTQAANLSAVITQPRWLLQLGYSTVLRLASSWPMPVQWDGYDWTPGGFGLLYYDEDMIGQQSARVDVAHSAAPIGVQENEAIFRLEGFEGQAASLWQWDRDAGEATPLIIDGFVDDGQIGDTASQLDIVGRISDRTRAPRATFGPPAFNHNIPAPARVTWQGEVVTLTRE